MRQVMTLDRTRDMEVSLIGTKLVKGTLDQVWVAWMDRNKDNMVIKMM